MDTTYLQVTGEAIRAAAQAMHEAGRIRRTPLLPAGGVGEQAGADRLFLKMENLQRTGSFKIRGATHRLSTLNDDEKARGVITASAGNHAQGVALAAREAGIAATVYMPQFASIAKIQATEGYGATVVLEGANFDEAVEAAKARSIEIGAVWVSAYDDDGIITGQGSPAYENTKSASAD